MNTVAISRQSVSKTSQKCEQGAAMDNTGVLSDFINLSLKQL